MLPTPAQNPVDKPVGRYLRDETDGTDNCTAPAADPVSNLLNSYANPLSAFAANPENSKYNPFAAVKPVIDHLNN